MEIAKQIKIHRIIQHSTNVSSSENISIEEIEAAVRLLKNDKAAGVDDISSEMLKCGGKVLLNWLCD